MTRPHPNQPIARDAKGVLRFKKNAIVDFLLEAGPFDMNQLRRMEFSQDDWEQFAQLVGYSVGGYIDLSYVGEARRQSIADEYAPTKTYQEGFDDGFQHAIETLRAHARGDYSG